MATWADFYPELMPHVVGCPNPTANVALREAARVFFERTRIWREWLEPVTVLANVREYDLELPVGAMVVRIERSTLGGNDLPVLSTHGLQGNPATAEQGERGISSRDRVTFTLARLLGAGAQVAVEVSLKPTKASAGIPDDLFLQHGQDIVEGAKERLMKIPKTDFYAPDLAMAARDEFKAAVASKTVVAWQGATGKVPRRRVGWC